MKRTLEIKGEGKLLMEPDTVSFHIGLFDKGEDYTIVVAENSDKYKNLQEAVVAAGFDIKDLKTSRYSIEPHYEISRENQNGFFEEKKFVGYECSQNLILTFPLDNRKVQNIFEVFLTGEIKPDVRVEYSVADTKTPKAKLLEIITKDAVWKAEALAKAADVTLGKLLKIDYQWENHRFYGAEARGGFADMVAVDIEISDSALYVWEIS